MTDDQELEVLLSLDGVSYEAAAGYVVEFSAKRTAKTPERPHGIRYALVFRPKAGGPPYVKFDNAHAVKHRGGKYVPAPTAYDHWHRTGKDSGRSYQFTTTVQLLEDFWQEVKRVMNGKGLPHDL